MKCRYCSLRVDGDTLSHYLTCGGVAQLGTLPRKRAQKPKIKTLCATCQKRKRVAGDCYCRECKNAKARKRWLMTRNVKHKRVMV